MSSETDHPRQRTVAELLAAHGGATPATGRRRRRREADEAGGPAPAGRADAAADTTAIAPPPPQVDRVVLRQPVPRNAPAPPPPPAPPRRRATAPPPAAAPARPGRDNPTDVIPRVRGPQPVEDLTNRLPRRPPAGDDEGGPSTMVGMAPVGAEEWHAERTATRRGGTAIDGGPPLPTAPPVPGDGPAGLGGRARLRDPDGHPDLRHDLDDDEDDLDGFDDPPLRERRLGRSAREAATTAWSTVLVQWFAGALGGAVLWVAFRFLWRSLPLVAIAGAAVVVVGLVLVVRHLLRNDDRRTTVSAVLVGLLLTVSPAVLVLLGR